MKVFLRRAEARHTFWEAAKRRKYWTPSSGENTGLAKRRGYWALA
ncbi:hypothetical protein HMPREF9080_00788 [Cardiobacterium valvarum F0432]|uniref:Uncharacterized protein n=1 Tax=Cardiobacterium valvarum F0432 TaxID=797473 RepID=G9ZDF4_9GAMM|nr:hypothetical protein HMPREF9080_00788 [Cardiobacterium valvarum F0432]